MKLLDSQNNFKLFFEEELKNYLSECSHNINHNSILLESQSYSLLSGGKRFRPLLTYLVFELFSDQFKKIAKSCLAVEMIHTYSLIHDDLPCMDNDDLRRGKPTNHKKFSQDIALLAGDGLLTDAFSLISKDLNINAEVKIKLIQILSEKAGSLGMVSGQASDMKVNQQITLAELELIHTQKTAYLIQAAASLAAVCAEVSISDFTHVVHFSFHLGMAFQIKDDILDFSDAAQDFKNYISIIGIDQTQQQLNTHSDSALSYLKKLNKKTSALEELIVTNLQRTH